MIDRDMIARAIEDRIKESPIGPPVFGQVGMPFGATMLDLADAVLAVLPTCTVAQALANAWWEGHVDGCDDQPFCVEMSNHRERNPYRTDKLENT